jgi:hypothetical protein
VGSVYVELLKIALDLLSQLSFTGYVLPGPVTSMTGPHDRSSTTASMNDCRFVLPTDPVSTSELDVSREWKDRCMPMNFLYEIRHIGISGHSDNMPCWNA